MRKFLHKGLSNSAWLWSRAWVALNKNQIFFVTKITSLMKNWFLLLVFREGKQRGKLEFETKFVRIINIITFVLKSLKLLVKLLLHIVFFTDHLKLKTVNETTYQLQAHYLENFPTVMIIFGGFQDLLIYLLKYFWLILNTRNFVFQWFFSRAMLTKQFN